MPFFPPISLKRSALVAGAYGMAVIAGAAGAWAHIPLAWMLGPMLVAATFSISGAGIEPNQKLRRLGQCCVGGAIGLYLTAPVIVQLAGWFPVMVVSALGSIALSCVFGTLLSIHGRIDQTTAFFASLPGGLAEMANVGSRLGAHPEPVALVQTLRIALVVLILPPILVALGDPDDAVPTLPVVDFFACLGVVAGGLAASLVVRLLRVNNPFMLGAVLFGSLLAATGILSGRFHPGLLAGAQLLIGFAVGCRFKRSMLVTMPRVALIGVLTILGMIASMGLIGTAIWALTGIGLPDALLATSPGGFAEMAATAQVLHLGVPFVAGFQVVRSVIVNGFSTHFYALGQRTGLLAALRRILT